LNEPTLTDAPEIDGAIPARAKILRFPTLIADVESGEELAPGTGALAANASGLSPRTSLTKPVLESDPSKRRSLLARADGAGTTEEAAAAASPWQRFALVRRRRNERAAGDGSASKPAQGKAAPVEPATARPTVPQLVTWLLNLRRSGVGFVYWNVAKLHIDTALMRAARLDDDAVIDVVGHRVLVIEPLRPRVVSDPALEAALETLVQTMPDPGPGMVVP
jgi:hypothetical protein